MTNPKIGIIVGSVREGRFAERAAAWLEDQASKRSDLDFEVLDLLDYPLPFYNEPQSPSSGKPAQNSIGQAWRAKLAEMDGFVFITAEYNHGPTAVLKNAIDWAWYEWNTKPVAFMGYGNAGAARAVEHLRGVAVEVELVSVRPAIHIGGADMFGIWTDGKSIDDFPHYEEDAKKMFDALSNKAHALRDGRQ